MTSLKPFTITFDNGNQAQAIRTTPGIQAQQALDILNLNHVNGTIVMHGGAAKTDNALLDSIRVFLRQSIIPFAQANQFVLVFGGTRSGVMQAVGDAYRKAGATFPMLGICPINPVSYPGHPADRHTPRKAIFDKHFATKERYPLDDNYTHFILLEDGHFGIESRLMVDMTQVSGLPGVAILINGGKISEHEALLQLNRHHPLIVIKGSGRIADVFATPDAAIHQRYPTDVQPIIIDLNQPDTLLQTLNSTTGQQRHSG